MQPLPASAPAGEFSAGRALEHLERFAAEPRPLGSPASDRARDYLVGRLRSEGLKVEVHRAVGARSAAGLATFGRVDNIVATLPGRDPTGTVMVAAHYDSAAMGPGASDDGAAVAAMLETVRALRAQEDRGDAQEDRGDARGDRGDARGDRGDREGRGNLRNDLVFLDDRRRGGRGPGGRGLRQRAPAGPQGRGAAELGGARRRRAVPDVRDVQEQRAAGRDVRRGRSASARRLLDGRAVPDASQQHRLHPAGRGGFRRDELRLHRALLALPHRRRLDRQPRSRQPATPRLEHAGAHPRPGRRRPAHPGLRRGRHLLPGPGNHGHVPRPPGRAPGGARRTVPGRD